MPTLYWILLLVLTHAIMGAAYYFYQLKLNQICTTKIQLFRELSNSIPQLVWTAKADGYVDYYSDQWYAFTGLDKSVFGEKSWSPAIHPDDLAKTGEEWFKCVKNGTNFQMEVRFKDNINGGYRWFLSKATPIKDVTGKIVKWCGTLTDVNDSKTREILLQERNQVLEKTNTESLELLKELTEKLVIQEKKTSVPKNKPTGATVKKPKPKQKKKHL